MIIRATVTRYVAHMWGLDKWYSIVILLLIWTWNKKGNRNSGQRQTLKFLHSVGHPAKQVLVCCLFLLLHSASSLPVQFYAVVYSGISPVVGNEAYSLVSVHRIETYVSIGLKPAEPNFSILISPSMHFPTVHPRLCSNYCCWETPRSFNSCCKIILFHLFSSKLGTIMATLGQEPIATSSIMWVTRSSLHLENDH